MTALTRPRGPLPRRVYWTRRALVVVVALGLVFGIARLLQTNGSVDPEQTAAPVGGSPTAIATSGPAAPDRPATTDTKKDRKKKKALPQPDGPCEDSDVLVSPLVRKAHVGDPVKVVLEVTTQKSPACYWDVSPDSVFVTISREGAPLWTSQQCTTAIPTEQVVARKEKAGKASFLWNGKESDAVCSAATDWALMGTYRVDAVARGATDPQDTTFVLGAPTRATVTRTPTPTATPSEDTEKGDRDGEKKNDENTDADGR